MATPTMSRPGKPRPKAIVMQDILTAATRRRRLPYMAIVTITAMRIHIRTRT